MKNRVLLSAITLIALFAFGCGDDDNSPTGGGGNGAPAGERHVGGPDYDRANGVAATPDGGCLIVGQTKSFGAGGYDLYIIRFNGAGDTLWTRTVGDTAANYGRAVVSTDDGGFIIVGGTRLPAAADSDGWIVKIDSLGDTMWTRTYGGTGEDWLQSIVSDGSGGYVAAGTVGWPATDYWLFRISTDGDSVWSTMIQRADEEEGEEVIAMGDGGFVLAGSTTGRTNSQHDILLTKVDANGAFLWEKVYDWGSQEYCYGADAAADGGFYITGQYSTGPGQSDMYVMKVDAAGDSLWMTGIGGADTDQALAVIATSDGGAIITGFTRPDGVQEYDLILAKVDNSGGVVWTKTYGGPDWDSGASLTKSSDGNYFVVGKTKSYGAGGYDVYVLKFDDNGNLVL